MRAVIRGLCTIIAVVLLMHVFGVGEAFAKTDPLVGRTLADASSRVTKWNGTVVVASVVGGVLDRDDCIVTHWQKSTLRNDFGHRVNSNYYLHLNCNNALAAAGTPGNSLASPEGQAQAKVEKRADWINTHPESCQKSAKAMKNCENFCTTHEGRCTYEPG
jgi:hypothetical protein